MWPSYTFSNVQGTGIVGGGGERGTSVGAPAPKYIRVSTIHTDSTSTASRVQHIHVRLTSPYRSPGAVSLYIYTAQSAACSLIVNIVPYAQPLSRCLYGHSRARPHSSPSAYNRHTNGHNDVCYGFVDYRPSHSVGRCQWNMTTSYFL